MSESQIVADVTRAVASGADATQRLILHYHATLHRVLERRIGPELRRYIDADDVLQHVYVAVFKDVSKGSFDSLAAFYRWLERIALARLADVRRGLRRKKRDVGREIEANGGCSASCADLMTRLAATDSTPSRKLRRREATAAMLSSLARLSDDRRTVIRMRFLEGRPVREIAAELGKTEAAVHQLTSRGLQSLRQFLGSITGYLTGL